MRGDQRHDILRKRVVYLVSVSCSDLTERGENDLPSEVNDSPQLSVVNAKSARVLPQTSDHLRVAHEAASGTLRTRLSIRSRRELLGEPPKMVRAKGGDVERCFVGVARGPGRSRTRESRGE